ncbi:MAG: hypothetical protein HY040_04645 [Planctomycetes bacterium]|nr:hypothetical protein [Planctomycetota bacterium]
MDPEAVQNRLSQISTAWSLLAEAHGGEDEAAAQDAQAALVERYQTAVYRYLLAAVRDPDVADELFQEFALRLVRGDFGRADARRGRFRDYVKTALINLVINHQRKVRQQRRRDDAMPEPVAPVPEHFDSDQEFLNSWRKALLDQAWKTLAAAEAPDAAPYFAVLRYRSENAQLTGAELAANLTAQLRPHEPFTETNLRKILQRAREKFSDILVEEVARSLGKSTAEELEQELIDLGFHTYSRRALDRRKDEPESHQNRS